MAQSIDESQVSYEPPVYDPATGETSKAYYYVVGDPAQRVQFVNPGNQESLSPSGHFEVYDGDADAYEPVRIGE